MKSLLSSKLSFETVKLYKFHSKPLLSSITLIRNLSRCAAGPTINGIQSKIISNSITVHLQTWILTNPIEHSPSSEPNTGSCLARQETVMEHEGQFPCPQESDTDRYPKPDKSHSISLISILILSCRLRLRLPSGIFPLFCNQHFYAFLFSPMHAASTAALWKHCPFFIVKISVEDI